MIRKGKFAGFGWILLVAVAFPALPSRGEIIEADLVVYGGTSAGVVAAVQGARSNLSVVLLSPEDHLGGLTSGGLGFTDSGHTRVIGGLSREFYHRVWKKYQSEVTWKWEGASTFGNRGQGTPAIDEATRTMWTFEPHVAEAVFDEWVVETGIRTYRNQWLDRTHGVDLQGKRIRSIRMLSGLVVRGRFFIDAGYEGDLMAAAGVPYRVGRESTREYGERWNGVQVGVLHHRHNFGVPGLAIDPYLIPGDPTSGLVAGISSEAAGRKGEADHRIQAYCFRMCLSDHPDNRVPFPRPPFYDPTRYELLGRILDAGWSEVFRKFDRIPNRKTDTNNHGPFSTDYIGANYEYPEATYERRAQIIESHRRYHQGLMYYLANDQRVPLAIRQDLSKWGLARDEFTDNGHWPHQLYVREARRMVGEYVMTEHEVLGRRSVPNPIGMGSYTMDSHNVQRYVTQDGRVENEGDIGVKPERPYSIALGAILPPRPVVQNLLVPVALSSTHIAYGSIRMEPVFMILGQSAGMVAAIGVEQGVPAQDVGYGRLKKRLNAARQILSLP